MKIITWNCNMAFRRKAEYILPYQPDILIVPECEHPDRLLFPPHIPKPTDTLWFGKNHHKGLGIFSFTNYRFTILENHDPGIQMVIPISVSNGHDHFNLFAIWANNPSDKDGRYIEQIWKAIHHYDHILSNTKTILVGDFNSNTMWDKEHKLGSHSNVVKLLQEKGIVSAYHLHHKQQQGAEAHPTLYFYRHQDRPYHIDYCFISDDFATKLLSVEVGEFDFWTKYSDHMPVMVSFENS